MGPRLKFRRVRGALWVGMYPYETVAPELCIGLAGKWWQGTAMTSRA